MRRVVRVIVIGFSSHSCGHFHHHVIVFLFFPFMLYDCLRRLSLSSLIMSCCAVTQISAGSAQSWSCRN